MSFLLDGTTHTYSMDMEIHRAWLDFLNSYDPLIEQHKWSIVPTDVPFNDLITAFGLVAQVTETIRGKRPVEVYQIDRLLKLTRTIPTGSGFSLCGNVKYTVTPTGITAEYELI